MVLRQRFKIELQAHKALLHALRDLLSNIQFPALRGHVLVLRAMEHGELVPEGMISMSASDADTLVIRLNPHLDVLEAEFVPQDDQSGQLPLFRSVRIR